MRISWTEGPTILHSKWPFLGDFGVPRCLRTPHSHVFAWWCFCPVTCSRFCLWLKPPPKSRPSKPSMISWPIHPWYVIVPSSLRSHTHIIPQLLGTSTFIASFDSEACLSFFVRSLQHVVYNSTQLAYHVPLLVGCGFLDANQFYSCLSRYRRKFRSHTSDNMDRWKADVGRIREEKKRRKKIREGRVRRQKMQVHEKVAKSRNTLFFQWFVAPESNHLSVHQWIRSAISPFSV